MPKLSNLIGHERAVSQLRHGIRHSTIGHAYLFSGPASVGKTTAARSFAKTLNCEQSLTLIDGPDDACEVCAACRQADAGVHPDIHLVRPPLLASETDGRVSTEILIHQVRELRRMLSLSPTTGRRKVFIISPADAMNEQAQNALLKSLEEPPAQTTLVLCAESVEAMLPTIRSRCLLVPFGLTPREVVAARLRELFGLSPEQAVLVARLSRGRPGLAVRYASDPELLERRSALLDRIFSALGEGPTSVLRDSSSVREAAAAMPIRVNSLSGDTTEAVPDRIAARIQLQQLFDELGVLVRDILLVSLGQGASELVINADRLQALTQLESSRTRGGWLRGLETVLAGRDLLNRNVNPQLLLEDALLELTWPV